MSVGVTAIYVFCRYWPKDCPNLPWRHLECLLDHVGVRGCHGDLRILSILAVRLPKPAVGAHLELIRSRGSWGVLNLLFVGVRGCS